jgi:voltage-gated potassium channel
MSRAHNFVHHAGAGIVLVILTLWLQSAGIGVLVAWIKHLVKGEIHKMGSLRAAALIVRLTTAVVVLHGLEILLWACFYHRWCLQSWDSAIYFSASSYSTLGCNDVSLPFDWRTVAPLESIIGVLMCGISVSLLFATVTRLIGREATAAKLAGGTRHARALSVKTTLQTWR